MELSPAQQVDLAKERFALRDYYGAVHLLEELVEGGRAFADAHHLLGLAYEMLEKPDRALAAFERALALNPRYAEAHVHCGIVLARLGREDEANEAFARARDAGGDDREGIRSDHAARLANLHADLAEAYAAAGALGRAIEQYRAALHLAPAFHDLRLKMAKHLIDAGRTLEARDEAARVVRVRPAMTDAKATFALASYLCGETETARDVLEQLQADVPDDPRVRAYLSLLERNDAARS